MLTKEELKIISVFRDDLFKKYTMREIAKKINKKSYNWVFNAVKKIVGLEIMLKEQKGHSSLCSINLDNNLTLMYLALLEQEKINKKLPLKNIEKLIQSVPLAYFTFIVAGSYAEGRQTAKSDLDIVVITENKGDVKKTLVLLKNNGDLMIPKAHIYVFSREEFVKMLLDREENYGKQIFKNHIIFFGAENYYFMIKEAVENGFKD